MCLTGRRAIATNLRNGGFRDRAHHATDHLPGDAALTPALDPIERLLD
jgi:hypothetical protein